MSDFVLSDKVDPDKVYLIKSSDLEGRFQVEFYKPQVTNLERLIKQKSTKTLRDYCLGMASGATPKSDEQDRYYSDAENGIPFLRVQNLEINGTINYDNFKYINKETHNGLLKRSQISGGDLLIKITGVGRMAIASVVPEGFVGNINQHIVAIKTENRNISEYLSRYFNLDIIETIASRHSTGGTRPALDFPSLLNLPIIENIDFAIIDKAISLRSQKFHQAKELLDSIDSYLLNELGITLPKTHYEGIKDRMFLVKHSDVVGKRLDSYFYKKDYSDLINIINKSYFPICKLYNSVPFIESGSRPTGGADKSSNDIFSIGGEHVNDNFEIGNGTPKYISYSYHSTIKITETKYNDIILVKDGATTGKVGIIQNKSMVGQNINEHVYILRANNEILINEYLVCYLHSIIGQLLIKREVTGATVTGITKQALGSVLIALPPLDKQIEIANTISSIRQQAKDLELEGEKILDDAKKEIEKMILG